MKNWKDIVNCIKEYDDIVIMTHTNMDGDAMGSASALCHVLRNMNKRCVILLEDAVPAYLNVIHHDCDYMPYFVSTMPYSPKLAIAVDCGDEGRIEKRLDVFKSAEKRICIDHHMQIGNFADYCVVDPDCAATALLIFELIRELGVEINKHIAEDLYVGILTDTGCFKYSNTTAEVHKVVAELYKYGIDHAQLCSAIYDSKPINQIKAEALAVEKMQLFANGKAVISSISAEEMTKLGVTYNQVDTCIDAIRVVEGTEISCMLKEKEPGTVKVSLRAKNYADVNAIAKAVGGGGHVRASGATMLATLNDARKILMAEIEKELSKY